MQYKNPELYILLFDEEDDILTASSNELHAKKMNAPEGSRTVKVSMNNIVSLGNPQ